MSSKSNKRAKGSPVLRHDDNEPSPNDIPPPLTLTLETLGHRGFLALPDELICMIFSYFTEIRIEDILANPTYLPGHFLDRFKALRNLSQLCQLSRKTYLPLLYERLQICIATKGAWYREHGNNLIRKCKGLLNSQHLWPYVRTITVCFTRFEPNQGLPLFVRLVKTLPNVETLEIPHAHGSITSIFKRYFQGNIFPTIRKAVMPTCAHEILRCCPGIRDVTCNEGDGGTLVSAVVSGGCRNLEVLDGIAAGPLQMKRLIAENPPLNRVRVNVRMKDPEKTIQSFSKFSTLRVIEIDSDDRDVEHLVKLASDTLHACTGHPVGGSKRGQKGATSASQNSLDPINSEVPSDDRVVRVLRFNRLGWLYLSEREKWTAAQFVPIEIKEFPVS